MTKQEPTTNLEELKQNYDFFKQKYNLPGFKEINELFDIEEIDADTELLLKRVRRLIAERVAGYIRFVEIILNPANAPMFFFKFIKKLDNEDKEVLNKIYETLGGFEIRAATLDLNYSKEKEAKYIKDIFEKFSGVKGDLVGVLEKLGNGSDSEKKADNGRSYFG